MSDPLRAPTRSGLLGEALGLLELPRLVTRFPTLARQPAGHGQRVLVLPGFGAGDSSTSVLRGYLRFLGYKPEVWGLGRNGGDVPDLLPRVVERLVELSDLEGEPIRLV